MLWGGEEGGWAWKGHPRHSRPRGHQGLGQHRRHKGTHVCMKQSWSGDLGPRCAGREDAILVIVSIHLHDSHGVTHGAELLNEHLGETSWSMAPRPHDLQNL